MISIDELMAEIRAEVAKAPSHEEIFAAFEALLKRLAPRAVEHVEHPHEDAPSGDAG